MEKEDLKQIGSSRARIRYLKQAIDRLEKRRDKILREGNVVADVVSCGKRGKKALGTVLIRGTSYTEEDRIRAQLMKRDATLRKELDKLQKALTEAEEYIAGLEDVEMRNILSLYYVEGLNWVETAHKMNELHGSRRKKYTESSCRQKHDRFIEKK